jgi:hypothetical protein
MRMHSFSVHWRGRIWRLAPWLTLSMVWLRYASTSNPKRAGDTPSVLRMGESSDSQYDPASRNSPEIRIVAFVLHCFADISPMDGLTVGVFIGYVISSRCYSPACLCVRRSYSGHGSLLNRYIRSRVAWYTVTSRHSEEPFLLLVVPYPLSPLGSRDSILDSSSFVRSHPPRRLGCIPIGHKQPIPPLGRGKDAGQKNDQKSPKTLILLTSYF